MNTEKTVRELAVENPQATRVFEQFGIDYCCGGGRTLSSACADKGVLVEEVWKAISGGLAAEVERQAAQDWTQRELSVLIDHITATHHVYVRQETVRIQQLLAKVAGKHGEKHPEVIRVQEVFSALSAELTSHLMKEENILFPYIVQLEKATAAGLPKPRPMFGSVKSPIHMMELEHASAGEALRSLRETATTTRLLEMPAPLFRRVTGRCMHSKRISISTFIWKTTFCSPRQFTGNAPRYQTIFHSEKCNGIQEALDRAGGGAGCLLQVLGGVGYHAIHNGPPTPAGGHHGRPRGDRGRGSILAKACGNRLEDKRSELFVVTALT